MKLNKFLEIFEDLDPNTEIEVPDLRFFGSDVRNLSKADLILELFKIKDNQHEIYKEKIVKQNTWFLVLIVILTIICGIQLIFLKLGSC